MERQSQHLSPQGLLTYFKVYLVETKSIHSLMWHWSLLKTGHYCVWLELATIFFCWSLKNTANGKEACQDDRVQVCLLSYLSKELLISLRQNISNLCQSIFVFLTVYYDKIFKHWLESSSIRLRVSFFIAFIHK